MPVPPQESPSRQSRLRIHVLTPHVRLTHDHAPHPSGWFTPRGEEAFTMSRMAQRRFHYEQAFEHYLRANGVPYVAVDEAKRALQGKPAHPDFHKLKSFDFVVYSQSGANLLIDVKGRKVASRKGASAMSLGNLQNWVTREDVTCLQQWSEIFGEGFEPAFAFLFWCDAQPPDALFLEVFEFGNKWYAVLAVKLSDYAAAMRDRSAKWDTVSVPGKAFGAMATPLKRWL